VNILVIGGAGFVGSHLVERLLADEHHVDVVDDLSRGTLANLREARALGKPLRIDTLDATSTDLQALITLRQPEVIYHLAIAPAPWDVADDAGRFVQSIVSTLEAARRLDRCKIVVIASASALYGDVAARDQPVKEGAVQASSAPPSVAGVLWRAAIELLTYYRNAHSVEFSVLVASTIYGPRQRPDGGVVGAFADAVERSAPAALHGDGRQTRDFLFIDDAVDALARATTKAGGLTVNIGTGVATAVSEVWTMMSSLAPTRGPAKADDVARLALSTTRARIHLGWTAWTDLASGLRALRN